MVPFDTVGKREVERGKAKYCDLGEVGVVGPVVGEAMRLRGLLATATIAATKAWLM